MLTVTFGEYTVNRTQVQFWYNQFKGGREDVNDNARPGSLSTSTTDWNNEENDFGNRWITAIEVADDVGISFGSCQAIFADVLGGEDYFKIAKFWAQAT